MRTIAAVVAYLAAIVAANLIVTEHGPSVAAYTAFALIGLDLVLRDYLHDLWDGRIPPLLGLIAAGSVISWLLNADAARVAVASAVAFGLAFTADWFTYDRLHRRPWLERSNWSNVAGAAVDSIVFLPLAFGGWPWQAIFALFTAKVAGGVIVALVLLRGAGRIGAAAPVMARASAGTPDPASLSHASLWRPLGDDRG